LDSTNVLIEALMANSHLIIPPGPRSSRRKHYPAETVGSRIRTAVHHIA
jgi:hypothetical protein